MAGAEHDTSDVFTGKNSGSTRPASTGLRVHQRNMSQSPPAAEATPDNAALVADDTDSAISIPAPSLKSLRSFVLDHQRENGRTYHSVSSGKYAWPNDNDEVERLEIQHNLWLLTFRGALGLCPKVGSAKRVLDAGTGSGVWAIDYADAHPEAEVVGVDLSPIQPWLVPPNCRFEVDDLEEEWTWAGSFDLIMSRAMTGCFSDYEAYIKKAYDALEPGGYLELQDIHVPFACDDGTLIEGSPLDRFGKLPVEASIALGRPLDVAPLHKDRLVEAGFVDVVERQFKWPVGAWPRDKHYKELGYWCYDNLDVGVDGLLMALLTRGMGWSRAEVLAFSDDVRRDLRAKGVHAYMPIYVVYGKKPGAAAE